jgi:hypothetical protein
MGSQARNIPHFFYLPPPMALADTAVLFCGTHFRKQSPKAPRPDDQSAVVPGFLLVSDMLQFVAFAFRRVPAPDGTN